MSAFPQELRDLASKAAAANLAFTEASKVYHAADPNNRLDEFIEFRRTLRLSSQADIAFSDALDAYNKSQRKMSALSSRYSGGGE